MDVRKKWTSFFWFLVLLAALSGCDSSSKGQLFEPDFTIKGTYYFQPKAAVNNFWSAFDLEQCKEDFQQIRNDGFNTVLLFIPWGVFQKSVNPVEYNESAFDDLERVLNLADSAGLKAVLRIGTHDHIPTDATGNNWFAATVMSDEQEWQAYQDLFREVAERTRNQPNVLFYFWTFEDTGYTPDPWFHQYSANLAAYRNWLKKRPLWWWNLLWGEENADYESIQPPKQNIPPLNRMKLRSFLQFSDELTARRLEDPCRSAKVGNPRARISFQPRPEINWGHDYSLQFALPDCYDFVTTWFSPYQSYMFGDNSKELDGKRLALYLYRYLERTRALSGGYPVFIDQFNFQHFGGHPEEGALIDENEELEFVATGLPIVLQNSLGYSLWNYYDYYLNVISNGFFGFDLEDWEILPDSGKVVLRRNPSSGHPAVEIDAGSLIRQSIGGLYPGHEYTLSFQGRSVNDLGELLVEFSFVGVATPKTFQFQLGPEWALHEEKVTIPKNSADLTVSFGPLGNASAVQLQELMFYPWVDTGGVYTVEREPRVALQHVFRRFNKGID